jgi:ketosteroid isomerase-like protein
MPTLRHSLLALASAGAIGILAIAAPAQTQDRPAGDQTAITKKDLAALVQLHTQANAAWMVGDARTFLDLIPLADDVTLMTAFGGPPSRSFDASPERLERLRHFFRNGILQVETVAAYAAGDLAVLALIERSEAEVGGLPRQPWALRVTIVYRREADGWRLVLRHADPLRGGMDVQEAAALARR